MAFGQKKWIEQAQRNLDAYQPVVIGVAGSTGKSTTIDFLLQLLEGHTPAMVAHGAPRDVMRQIAEQMQPHHRIVVIEMQSHTPNAIDELVEWTQPIIGVVTSLTDRHHKAFADRDEKRDTISALMRSLPSSGLAVLNHDHEDVRTFAKETSAPVRYFSVRDAAHATVSRVTVRPHDVNMVMHLQQQQIPLALPLRGKHIVPSLLAASTVAHAVGVPTERITERLRALSHLDSSFTLTHGKNHAVIILDPAHPHPEGAKAALDYLHLFEDKRKIVITAGMNDLGRLAREYHVRLGNYIASIADQLIITDRRYARHLKQGALAGGMEAKQVQVITSPRRLIRRHLSALTPYDVVLLEGPVQQKIVVYILEK